MFSTFFLQSPGISQTVHHRADPPFPEHPIYNSIKHILTQSLIQPVGIPNIENKKYNKELRNMVCSVLSRKELYPNGTYIGKWSPTYTELSTTTTLLQHAYRCDK